MPLTYPLKSVNSTKNSSGLIVIEQVIEEMVSSRHISKNRKGDFIWLRGFAWDTSWNCSTQYGLFSSLCNFYDNRSCIHFR